MIENFLVFVAINYFMVGLASTGGQFFIMALVFALMSFNSSALGLLMGSIILDTKSVSAVVPIFLLPIILFAGFFKNKADLPHGLIGFNTSLQINMGSLDLLKTKWLIETRM